MLGFGNDNELLRNFASFYVFQELVMKEQKLNQESRNPAKPSASQDRPVPAWPARRRFWHRLWPAPDQSKAQNQPAQPAPQVQAEAA